MKILQDMSNKLDLKRGKYCMKKEKEQKQMMWLLQETRGAGRLLFAQAIAGAGLQISQLLMVSHVVVEFINHLTGEGRASIANLIWLSMILLVILLVSYYFFAVLGQKSAQILWRNSRERIFEAIHSRNLALLQKRHSAELLMLLNDDSRKTSDAFATIFTSGLADVVVGIGALILMLMINWQISLVMVGSLAVLTVFFKFFMSIIQKTTLRMQGAEEDVRQNLQEGIIKILLLKAYRMTGRFTSKHRELYVTKTKAAISYARAGALYNMTSGVMGFSTYLIIYGIGGFFVIRGDITVGELVGMATLSGFLKSPVFKFGIHIQSLAAASASAKRIRAVLELPDELKAKDVSLGQVKELNVQDVHFAYDEKCILNGVSVSAKPGDIIGIIGESGSGKSTFTKVLMGFYAPMSGNVQLIDQDNKTTDNILHHMAYVPSGDFLFTATVKENICMANPVVKEEMIIAAKAAGIHDFIESLPERYDTIIGEGLNSLSSGQGQRIGIARALYANKPVLIFDEPTSNLDVNAISSLHKTIKDVTRDKICLIVTHDLATKEICNKIYKIASGNIMLEYPLNES